MEDLSLQVNEIIYVYFVSFYHRLVKDSNSHLKEEEVPAPAAQPATTKPVDDDDIFASSAAPPTVNQDDDDDLFKSAAPPPVKVEDKKDDLFTPAAAAASSTPPAAAVEKEIDLEDDDDDDIFKSARLEPEPAKVFCERDLKNSTILMCCAILHKPGKNRILAAVKVGGGPAVVTNGAMMREEPAEMEIPLEEEEVASS